MKIFLFSANGFFATVQSFILLKIELLVRFLLYRLLFLTLLSFSCLAALAQTCPPATVTIHANFVLYCYDTAPQFTATVQHAGNSPTYRWKINGLIQNGFDQGVALLPVATGDVITCEVMGTNACGQPVSATSNSLTILSNPGYNKGPEVTIAASQETICAGTLVTFTATNVSESATPVFQWLVNGNLTGVMGPVFATRNLANGDKVECIMTVPHCFGGGSQPAGSRPADGPRAGPDGRRWSL